MTERKFIKGLKECLRTKAPLSDEQLAYVEAHFCTRNTWVLEALISLTLAAVLSAALWAVAVALWFAILGWCFR